MTKEEILAIPIPERTNSYTPIAHGDFINTIEEKLQTLDFQLKETKYITNNKGTKVIGVYQLQSELDAEIGPSIAFRNSYDKSMSAGIAVGSNVFVCTNGMFTGEVTIMRKHTGTADNEMQQHIFQEMYKMQQVFDDMRKFKENLKSFTFNDEAISSLVGDLYFKFNILKSSQLSVLKKEYYNPTIDYNIAKNNAWHLYNLTTHAIEFKSHPTDYIKQHEQVFKYFNSVLNIK